MKKLLFLLFFPSALTASAQNTQSPVAAVVFKNVKTKASYSEQNRICRELELSLGADRGVMMGGEFPVHVQVFPTDLNKDGQEELFISLGSSALYGMTGEGFQLYQQNKTGNFVKNADVGGTGMPTFLTSSNMGYPDLLIGGPGFEFPVYRWNGRTYAYHKVMKDAALQGKPMIGLDSLSRRYLAR